jgi:hypothetical protein
MNSQFPHDEIKPFASDKAKKQQVEEMFDGIACPLRPHEPPVFRLVLI